MANVTIGSVTPSINPSEMTLVRPDKITAYKITYGGAVYFSWPISIVGKIIEITWDIMKADEFALLDTLYAADSVVVFNPNDGLNRTYNVNTLNLDGKYLVGMNNASTSYRKEVKLTLLIMSQV